MGKEPKMDRETTDAVAETLTAMGSVLRSFSRLCDSGSEYLDAKTRERFAPYNMLPLKPPKKGGPEGLKAKELPPKKAKDLPPSKS